MEGAGCACAASPPGSSKFPHAWRPSGDSGEHQMARYGGTFGRFAAYEQGFCLKHGFSNGWHGQCCRITQCRTGVWWVVVYILDSPPPYLAVSRCINHRQHMACLNDHALLRAPLCYITTCRHHLQTWHSPRLHVRHRSRMAR